MLSAGSEGTGTAPRPPIDRRVRTTSVTGGYRPQTPSGSGHGTASGGSAVVDSPAMPDAALRHVD